MPGGLAPGRRLDEATSSSEEAGPFPVCGWPRRTFHAQAPRGCCSRESSCSVGEGRASSEVRLFPVPASAPSSQPGQRPRSFGKAVLLLRCSRSPFLRLPACSCPSSEGPAALERRGLRRPSEQVVSCSGPRARVWKLRLFGWPSFGAPSCFLGSQVGARAGPRSLTRFAVSSSEGAAGWSFASSVVVLPLPVRGPRAPSLPWRWSGGGAAGSIAALLVALTPCPVGVVSPARLRVPFGEPSSRRAIGGSSPASSSEGARDPPSMRRGPSGRGFLPAPRSWSIRLVQVACSTGHEGTPFLRVRGSFRHWAAGRGRSSWLPQGSLLPPLAGRWSSPSFSSEEVGAWPPWRKALLAGWNQVERLDRLCLFLSPGLASRATSVARGPCSGRQDGLSWSDPRRPELYPFADLLRSICSVRLAWPIDQPRSARSQSWRAWSFGYRQLPGHTLEQSESPGEERSGTPTEPQGNSGNTLEHGVASKCRRGEPNE